MKTRQKYTRIITVLIVVAVLLVAAILFTGFRYQQETSLMDNIFVDIQQTRIEYLPNIRIDGVNVGGLTEEEARERIASVEPPLLGSLTVVSGEKEVLLNLNGLLPLRNSEEALQSAILLGNGGDAELREADAAKIAAQGGQDFYSEYQYDLAPIKGEVERVAAELSTEPQDARVEMKKPEEVYGIPAEGDETERESEENSQEEPEVLDIEDFVEFIPGVPGNTVDPEELFRLLQQHLDQGTLAEMQTLEISGTSVLPEKTLDSVKENFTLVSSTTSSFAKGSNDAPNRVFNLQKACDLLNGYIIQPGEQFSCNTVFGPRSERTGWKAAGAISNGKSVQEVGGGICQVSSTLFNSVLKADLEIVDRVPHSWPLAYLPAGQDATISTGGPDFVFANNRSTPVVLITNVDTKNKELTIDIYGEPVADGMEIRLVSEKTGNIGQPKSQTTTDPEAVRKGRSGSTYDTYKEYYKQDQLVRRELAYNTRYRAFSTITLAGSSNAVPENLSSEGEETESTSRTESEAPVKTPTPEPAEERVEDLDLEELIPDEGE